MFQAHPIAATVLCLVKSDARALDRVVLTTIFFAKKSHAKGRGNGGMQLHLAKVATLDGCQARDCFSQALGKMGGVFGANVFDQDQKSLPAPAANGIAATQVRTQSVVNARQYPVTCVMAEPVVHGLEVVKVQRNNTLLWPAFAKSRPSQTQFLRDAGAVQSLGQHILGNVLRQLAPKLATVALHFFMLIPCDYRNRARAEGRGSKTEFLDRNAPLWHAKIPVQNQTTQPWYAKSHQN